MGGGVSIVGMVYWVLGCDGYIYVVNRYGEKYGQQFEETLLLTLRRVYNKCESLSPVTAAEDNI